VVCYKFPLFSKMAELAEETPDEPAPHVKDRLPLLLRAMQREMGGMRHPC
jgi:hypothetical protein